MTLKYVSILYLTRCVVRGVLKRSKHAGNKPPLVLHKAKTLQHLYKSYNIPTVLFDTLDQGVRLNRSRMHGKEPRRELGL